MKTELILYDEKRWLEAQNLARQVSLMKAKNKSFFLQQKFYEEGENTGHMLAMMAKFNKGSTFISAVRDSNGNIIDTHSDIIKAFSAFYSDLYCSKISSTTAAIREFLSECSLPQLSQADSASHHQ